MDLSENGNYIYPVGCFFSSRTVTIVTSDNQYLVSGMSMFKCSMSHRYNDWMTKFSYDVFILSIANRFMYVIYPYYSGLLH